MKKLLFVFAVMLAGFSAFADELFKSNVTASYYATKFHGQKTASGETFNMYAFTAAHKDLPFNTLLKVTNLANGKSVQVRVNDRGPFAPGREIDLSVAAAEKLDMLVSGTAQVSIEIVQLGETTTETVATGTKKSPALSPNKRWDIQLGAFKRDSTEVPQNAKTMAQRLIDAGFKNVIYQHTSQVTRVIIKDIPTENVQSILSELENKGFKDYFVRERKNDTAQSGSATFDAK